MMNAQFVATLKSQAKADTQKPILSHFDSEPGRMEQMTLDIGGLYLDLSKQAWSHQGLKTVIGLIEGSHFVEGRESMWSGAPINVSENRAVLHVALRDTYENNVQWRGLEVATEVASKKEAMRAYGEGVRSGAILGATGKQFTHIVHIGIGGSDLGPRLLWQALGGLNARIDIRFVANVDGSEMAQALSGLDPETTLIIAVSKTFGTQETLANVMIARDWIIKALGEAAVGQHMTAVSAAPEKTRALGIPDERVFGFKDWVGGRYSLWSAVSLSVMIALGFDEFEDLLKGARAMDAHFFDAPLESNGPVLLAAAQLYNRIGLDLPARCVIPYAHRIRRFAAFLQQLEMESNGKRVTRTGDPIDAPTCPIVFGDEGTNAQHAFFQMLHQSNDVIPLELICVVQNDEATRDMQDKLMSNIIAQAEAFMVGKSFDEAMQECARLGLVGDEAKALASQKQCPGNKPSTVIMMDRLTPYNLGALLALYEHKTFVEGLVMGLNSFDQWGVELGKSLGTNVLEDITGDKVKAHDASTLALIERVKTPRHQ